jgi:hypothetical protein
MIKSTQLLSHVGPIHLADFHGDTRAEWYADETDGTRVRVRGQVYAAMGRPEEITVTIEPGDKLNDDRPRGEL